MKKLLLVYDDFNEMTLTQSVLKKLGFDVVSISNEFVISQQLVSFGPDVVIVSGGSQKVNTISVAIRMKEMKKYPGKVLLILPPKVKPSPLDLGKMRMDLVMEPPVSIPALLQALSQLGGPDEEVLLEKLRKFAPQLAEKAKPKNRSARYAELTKDLKVDLKQSSHSKTELKARQKDMKKDWNQSDLDDQDRLRREFATALFNEQAAKKKASP